MSPTSPDEETRSDPEHPANDGTTEPMLPSEVLGRRNVRQLDLNWPRRMGPGSRVESDLVRGCDAKAPVQDGMRTCGQSDKEWLP